MYKEIILITFGQNSGFIYHKLSDVHCGRERQINLSNVIKISVVSVHRLKMSLWGYKYKLFIIFCINGFLSGRGNFSFSAVCFFVYVSRERQDQSFHNF